MYNKYSNYNINGFVKKCKKIIKLYHLFFVCALFILIILIHNIFFTNVKEGLSLGSIGRKVSDASKKISNVPKAFKQMGDLLNKALVKPLLALFDGIGNIFTQTFKILAMIGDKIVSLPNCILTYAFKTSIDTAFAIYDRIIPSLIRTPISFLYKYTIGIIVNLISYYSGYDSIVQKCYGFNINDQVDSMKKTFTKIETSFKKDFGKIDFAKIKI
jgi:hypothetical protein